MYRILYSGFDTLDIAIAGAFSDDVLQRLAKARQHAESSDKEHATIIGPGKVEVFVKSHGCKGGFRYVMTDGPTGAIFMAKADNRPSEWNLFVSVRALRLLTLGYGATKQWLWDMLGAMGFRVTDHSVNRLDYAVDILAPGFQLDLADFVAPARAKVRPYWGKEQLLDDPGNVPQAVIRGRRVESATVGMMPNRQVILYDKRRAALDLKQLYWFEVWGTDRSDLSQGVWRLEIRAGRDALSKKLLRRRFDAVEAYIGEFLQTAAAEVRYIDRSRMRSNISRVPDHPLWETARSVYAELPIADLPPLPEARALEILREQRCETAEKQAFGTLINALVLSGVPEAQIVAAFEEHAEVSAYRYASRLGEKSLRKKVKETAQRLSPLLPNSKVDLDGSSSTHLPDR